MEFPLDIISLSLREDSPQSLSGWQDLISDHYSSHQHTTHPHPPFLKRIYDIFGVLLSIFILNYAASPFILFSKRESLMTWSRLGWYGQIVVTGGLVFVYVDGTKFFRSLQKAKGILPPSIIKVAAAAVSAEWDFFARFGEKVYASTFG